MDSIKESKMTKTTNILRCTLLPTIPSGLADELDELPDIELHMLCSDKIAAVARKLELTDVVDLHNNDRGKFQKYLSESISLDEKIVKAFKRQIKYEIDKRQVNPDALSFERRYELERIRLRRIIF
jgi:hypothetical protein